MIDISLVVTAHQRRFLAEALISVAAQTDKRFELILCLDLSKDVGLREYCIPCFEMIECKEKKMVTIYGNGTAGYCRNEAFRYTHGNWIAYLDGDDMIMPNAICVMRNAITNNEKYDIFSSGMVRIRNDGEIVELKDSLTYYPPINIYDVDPEVVGEPTYFNQFQIMRREVWEGYEYDISSNGEDIDFMLIQLLKWKYKKVSQYLYFYRDVDGSFSKETYEKGDFTTQRYQSGYYHDYFEEHFDNKFVGNFMKIE